PEGATVLTDETDPMCAIGAFGNRASPADLDRLADAFRTGLGVSYDEHGPATAHATERMLGPWITSSLVPTILPALPDAYAALERGARVADIGCGGGVALEAMARRFPNSEFHGWDPSTHAIARARERLALVDNAWADVGRAEDLATHGAFDFVLALDCLHDMTRPDLAVAAVFDALAPDGTWLIKDIRSTGDLAANMKNPVMAMQYAISVEVCMSSALSEPDGMGLGTCGLPPDRMEEMCRAAGFTRFTLHDFGEPANLYYEVRP
ncbi:MAG TPA: class I SAM-dependent methyltransferase, partial [Acidimicrobiales bacterium]|nr:class I SAM-dependent methyltransferase [Acidimicrobiales bacterium]